MREKKNNNKNEQKKNFNENTSDVKTNDIKKVEDNKENKLPIAKKEKSKKEKDPNKYIESIKKNWIIEGTNTFLLIAIIVAIFIAINIVMQKLELTPIDFSQEKLYTLTEESKEKVKNIDKDVNLYFIGYSNENSTLDLAKQYKKINEKIVAEAVEISSRPDLANKYGIENGTEGIIVECGEKFKILTSSDLVTYDTQTYETISVAEEKLTSSILSVASNKTPKVYFLTGYSEFSLTQNMNLLNIYLQNEINEIESLNVLTIGKIPEDCDTLVITTPTRDFDEITTNAILEYIELGRNILWLNSAVTNNDEMPNVNKILATYGVKPFETGIIRETDAKKMVTNSPDLILPDVQYSKITKDLYNRAGMVFINATKINIDVDKLEELNVEENDLLLASENSYFRNNFNIQTDGKTEADEAGTFVVGAELVKTIKQEKETETVENQEEVKDEEQEIDQEENTNKITSKLVIYGENYFISDYPLSQGSPYAAIQIATYNKDLVLNSIAYLVDREEDITARKSTGTVTYTASKMQDTIIRIVIFAVPILIITFGIVVWQVRRRKK